jgi:hypothetical protein
MPAAAPAIVAAQSAPRRAREATAPTLARPVLGIGAPAAGDGSAVGVRGAVAGSAWREARTGAPVRGPLPP